MALSGSVTHWLHELSAGNHQAAQKLWEIYFQRLVELARARLRKRPWGVADEEDVALSAFDSFYRGAEQGRFPQLSDRDDLWQLLVMITCRKAADLVQQECRRKRGGKGKGQQGLASLADGAGVPVDMEHVLGTEPSPEFAAEMTDQCRYLLGLLDDARLRAIALWKMEGYTNAEIAEKLGCVSVTVERRLRLIRSIWAKALGQR